MICHLVEGKHLCIVYHLYRVMAWKHNESHHPQPWCWPSGITRASHGKDQANIYAYIIIYVIIQHNDQQNKYLTYTTPRLRKNDDTFWT